MTDKDTARQAIAQLVEKYRQIKPSDLKGYKEEETKKDFLVPMFHALGWDMEDRSEVRAEEQIGSGFADYSFRLNGVTHFYLEAKRFSADLNDKKFMQQAINYAYLKGVTWTVLSDFQQLMVFNADWEERDPLQARFIDLTWEQYAEDGFEQLWLLSKPSLERREIDAEAEKWGKKKTRARVTDVLFADLTRWRQALFKDIRGYAETLWSRDAVKVDEAIQRFLDRLIFIRTVEDRQIEDNRLRALLHQYDSKRGSKKNLFHDLVALFRELNTTYNARLFAETTLDHLTVNDENLLRDMIDSLYDVKSAFATYDFSAMDADVLGAVYEQYLGFKALDPRGEDAIDLRKSAKRKAQGIYYTPHFVVRYIVQQTLGKLLNAPDMTPEKAHQLRILDPACGSGSFLIEAFDVLDGWLAEHGDELDRNFPHRRKMRILQENFYGVDLDPQAVEVARLNLLLRAAHERQLLPMLDNIKHGNSLIDDPAVAGETAFKWEEQFPGVMNAGGFDVVIGNPPYGAKLSDYEREYLTWRFESGNTDTAALMMVLATQLLRPGGWHGFIVPKPFTYSSNWKTLRQLFLDELYELVDVSKAWKDVKLEQVIYILQKGAITQLYRSLQRNEQEFVYLADIPKTACEQFDFYLNGLSQAELEIGSKVTRTDMRLGNFITNTRGGMFQNLVKKDLKCGKRVVGGKQISRYGIVGQKGHIKDTSNLPSNAFVKANNILVQNIVAHIANPVDHIKIIATMVSQEETDSILVLDTVNQLENHSNLSSNYLIALLHSQLINWWVYRFIFAKAIRTMHFDGPVSNRIPIRPIDFDDPADKARHDRMVSMVEQMLALKKEHAAAEAIFDDRRHDLSQQIARLDADIDALVYELYGLTDDEIAIVEGRTPG